MINESPSFRVLPGTPAQRWHDRAGAVYLLVTTPTFIAGLLLLVVRDLESQAWAIAFFATLAIFLASVVAGLGMGAVIGRIRENAELRSGYTSLLSLHREYPQLAPFSAVVIRYPGEPLLSRHAYVEACKAAKPESR